MVCSNASNDQILKFLNDAKSLISKGQYTLIPRDRIWNP